MISCIICSRQTDLSAELKENIASTIGCEYELVVIDNSKNEYSIFSAYNEGVRRAQGDILCFMHEDVLYHTDGWGKSVVDYFLQYPSVGLLGVAGTHFLSHIPSGWWETECKSCHLIQGYTENGEYKSSISDIRTYMSNPTCLVAIDGLWMCMRKDVFIQVSWDDVTFNGFHAYDVDMSLQIWSTGLQVHMIWDVLIEHKSLGCFDDCFYDAYAKLWAKWREILPMNKGVELSIQEYEIRTRIVELNEKIRKQHKQITSIYSSKAYRLGNLILKPIRKIKKLLYL